MPCYGCSALHGVNPNLKNKLDYMPKKEIHIKDEGYPKVQLEKLGLHQNETTINPPITAKIHHKILATKDHRNN